MQKLIKAYFPFFIYSACIAFAYFIFFYLLPKYDEALTYFGFLAIYAYIFVGVFLIGYIMGRIVAKRIDSISILQCIIFSIVSFFIMLIIGSLKYVFYFNMYNRFSFSFSKCIESLTNIESKFISIGTFTSFLIGELTIFIQNKHK